MRVAPFALLPLVVACVHHQEAASPAESELTTELVISDAAPPVAPAPDPQVLEPAMHQFFWSTTDGRDLVVAGEIEAARSAFSRLLEEPVPDELPAGWAEGIAAVRAVAVEASAAASVGDIARGVAEASAQCGDCHAQHSGGPGVAFAAPPDLDESLEGAMHRHAWAADRLWEGLAAPSDERWAAGVAAAFSDPAMTGANGDIDWALQGDIDAVAGADRAARVAFYGDFIAACASCHDTLGVELGEL